MSLLMPLNVHLLKIIHRSIKFLQPKKLILLTPPIPVQVSYKRYTPRKKNPWTIWNVLNLIWVHDV